MEKKYDLSRFVSAQERDYKDALKEITNGRKQSHWMWYIFPQIKGLGMSYTSNYYGIENLEEAVEYLQEPYLKDNLVKICGVLLSLETDNPTKVFGRPDDMKLKSSMTLFACANPEETVFQAVLDKYFGGIPDYKTMKILELEGNEIGQK